MLFPFELPPFFGPILPFRFSLVCTYTCGSLTDGTAHVAAPPKCRPVSIHADMYISRRLPPLSLSYVMGYTPPSRLMASFWLLANSLVMEPDSQLVRLSNFNFKTLSPIGPEDTEEEAHDAILERQVY